MSKRFEICLAGSGGQGVITAAIMVGEAASIFCDGLYAVQTQSYGPAARGGSAKAEVVISDEIVTNMVALGMVARVLELEGMMKPEAVRKAMLDRVPKGTEELNSKAFDEGYSMFKDAPAHMQ